MSAGGNAAKFQRQNVTLLESLCRTDPAMEDVDAQNPSRNVTSTACRRFNDSGAEENNSLMIRGGANGWVTFEEDTTGTILTSDCGAMSFSSSFAATPLRPAFAPLSNQTPIATGVAAGGSSSASEIVGKTSTPCPYPGFNLDANESLFGRYHTLSPVLRECEGERMTKWETFDDEGGMKEESGDRHVSEATQPEMTSSWKVMCKLKGSKRKDPWVPVRVSIEGISLVLLKCSEEELYGINDEQVHPGQLEEVELSEVLPYHEIELHHGMAFTDKTVRQTEKQWKSHFVKLRSYEFKEKRRILKLFQRSHKKKSITALKLCSDDPYVLQGCIDAVNQAILQLPVTVSRAPSTVYVRNEVFVDVEENCEVEAKWDGHVIQQKATDKVHITAFISHTPECRLVLNDRRADEVQSTSGFLPPGRAVTPDNISMHPCVDKDAFHMNRSIRFRPLDAVQFQLLQCDTSSIHEPPLKATVSYRVDNALVTMTATLERSKTFSSQLCLSNVVMKFPIPGMWAPLFIRMTRMGSRSVKSTRRLGIRRSLGTEVCQIQTNVGKAKYEPEFGSVVWRIGRVMPGPLPEMDDKPAFHCQLQLLPDFYRPDTSTLQIELDYDVPGFTSSDLRVRAFRVVNSSCSKQTPHPRPKKYVKYLTHYHCLSRSL